MSDIEQPAARSGRITCWCGALKTSALSAMKCTPQKTMNSASGCLLISPRELERVADVVGELDDLVALVVVAEDDDSTAELGARRGDAAVHLLVREAEVFLGERLALGDVLFLVRREHR